LANERALEAIESFLSDQFRKYSSIANVTRRYRRRRIEKKHEGRFLEKEHFQVMAKHLTDLIPALENAILQRSATTASSENSSSLSASSSSYVPLDQEFATLYERCFLLKLMFHIGQQRSGILTVMDIVSTLEKRSDGCYIFHPGMEKTTFLQSTNASRCSSADDALSFAGASVAGQRMLVLPKDISMMIDFIIQHIRPVLLQKKYSGAGHDSGVDDDDDDDDDDDTPILPASKQAKQQTALLLTHKGMNFFL
jgi:hypothetical protein